MNNDELMHYGKMGMHWGAKKGVVGKHSPAVKKLMAERQTKKMTTAKSAVDSAKTAVDAGKNINSAIVKSKADKKASKMDLSKMTDKEMQDKVNRLNLEQRYSKVMTSQTTKGHVNVDTVLNVAGSVLAIGASSIGIALSIKALKDKTI